MLEKISWFDFRRINIRVENLFKIFKIIGWMTIENSLQKRNQEDDEEKNEIIQEIKNSNETG